MSVCRLCSSREQIFDVFHSQLVHGQQLRLSIFLATGIEIKEIDVVSKMVCHRCCEIAVKLHKYRTNAIANDKLLKEQCSQPYTPPIVNQDEILRVAAEIISERMDEFNQNNSTSANPISESSSSQSSNPPDQSTIVETSQNPNDTSVMPNKIVRKTVYKHSSVRGLYRQYKNIILPSKVFKSDVSPLISLDSTEVSNWYAEQASSLQKRLTHLIITKISCNSTSEPSSSTDKNVGSIIPPKSIPDAMQSSANDRCLDGESHVNADQVLSSFQNENHSSTMNVALIKTVPQLTANKVHQRARKKTTRKIQTSRKRSIHRDDAKNEIIPEKKIRGLGSKIPTKSSNKLDLPKQLPTDGKKRKTIFTSSLESTPAATSSSLSTSLTPPSPSSSVLSTPVPPPLTSESDSVEPLFEQVDCQHVMTKGKTLSIFICSMCNQLCDTKRQLQDHEKVHLTCKFCKKRLKNLKLLQKHQNEFCFINIVTNPPNLELTRVDSIKSVVERYPEAFKELLSQEGKVHESLHNISANILEDSAVSDGIELNNINTNNIEQFASPSNQSVECIRIVTVDKQPTIVNDNSNQAKSSEIEIVCLTDDSDDEIECTEMSRHPIVNNPHFNLFAKPRESRKNSVTNKTTLAQSNIQNKISRVLSVTTLPPRLNTGIKPQNYLNEREMIHSLFKKYSVSSIKCNTSLQTNAIPTNLIKCTDTNLIILENLLLELLKYRIPVQFESKPRISAKFLEQPLLTENEILESWETKKAINVQKPGFSSYLKPLQPSTSVTKKSNVAPNGTNVPIPAQKNTSPVILNSQQSSCTGASLPILINHSNNTITKSASSANANGMSSLGQFSLVTLPATPATFVAQNSNASNLKTTPLIINSASTESLKSGGYMQLVDTANGLSCPTLYIPQSGALIQNTQQNEKAVPINNNVTNVNKYFVLASPSVAQLSGINLEYLNCSPNQVLQFQQNQTNQKLTVVTPTTTCVNSTNINQPIQSQSGMVRVKNLWELTQ